MKLAQVILFVADIAAMQAFYQDAIGLDVVDGTAADGWVRLDAGGCLLALHASPPGLRPTIASPPVPREEGVVKLAFRVDDMSVARDALIARGAVMGAIKAYGAVGLCDGVDPEGNVFQISTRG